MANYMNYLSGVGLYVLLILVLYGQKEILPKNVYKAFDNDKNLKAPTRDKSAQPVVYKAEVAKLVSQKGVSGSNKMHKLSEALGRGQ